MYIDYSLNLDKYFLGSKIQTKIANLGFFKNLRKLFKEAG